MPVFPLSEQTRQQLVQLLDNEIGGKDPLPFLKQHVFEHYPTFNAKILLPPQGQSSWMYYSALIRNIELSAWAARPPMLVTLLRAFPQASHYQNAINLLLNEGPFQCHPQNSPYWVCRVATELPLVGRDYTRAAGMAFNVTLATGNQGKRVLRVHGPSGSGKTHTLNFLRYLENVQPLMVGVIDIDFKDQEIATQAATPGTYIESFLAERMEAQVRRRRAELLAAPPAAGPFPDLLAILNATPPAHSFRPLTDLQQRVRWAKELANEFVDDVIFNLNPQPAWWVVVFDNCGLAPPESHEFIRRLVERAAGTTSDPASVTSADTTQLRVVLLGDSGDLLPANLYKGHVIEEDLHNQQLGLSEVQRYFITFRECREIDLDAARIQQLTTETLSRADEIMQQPPPPTTPPQPPAPPPPWPRALATAIIEKTLPLDELSAQKKGGV